MNTQNDIYENNKTAIEALVSINPEKGNKFKERFLIAEAKRRGFKEGVKVKPLNLDLMVANENDYVILKTDTPHEFERNNLWIDAGQWNAIIFEDGVWATIIEEEKPEQNQLAVELEKAEFRFKVDKMQAELEKLKLQFEKLLK